MTKGSSNIMYFLVSQGNCTATYKMAYLANQNLTEDVLKTILRISKVKEQ